MAAVFVRLSGGVGTGVEAVAAFVRLSGGADVDAEAVAMFVRLTDERVDKAAGSSAEIMGGGRAHEPKLVASALERDLEAPPSCASSISSRRRASESTVVVAFGLKRISGSCPPHTQIFQ